MARSTSINSGDRERSLRRDWLLILTAGFALIWICHRAFVQSITLDEADSYLRWVAPAEPAHWEPHSNNHVLNSTLMRLSIWLFGLSEMSLRAPALLGGLLYIFSIFRLCTLLAGCRVFRWALFVCFVYNPFVMDYLVAARGYGLALGFLSLAIYLFAGLLIRDGEDLTDQQMLNRAMAISSCVALSICANFAFAYATGFLLAAAGAVAGIRWLKQKRGAMAMLRLAAAFSFPAVLILAVLAGSALTRFPRDQLFWGSQSLSESWKDIREASFYELNPYLVNPLLASFLEFFKHYVFRALALFGAGYMVLLLIARRQLRDSATISRLLLAGSLAVVLALTVLAHWLQFRLMKIPLPLERVSIFVVPLATAFMGASLAFAVSNRAPIFNRMAQAWRGFGIAILLIAGVYFVGELRDSYFREWRELADVKTAFPVVVDLCRRAHVREVPTDPNLTSSFKFYKAVYKVNDIDEFLWCATMPPDKPIYVVLETRDGEFMHTKGLEVAWRGTFLVVLVRPERLEGPK